MDPNIISALIGGTSGIVAAYLTARITSSANQKQTERTEAKDAAFLTSQAAPALRAYASECLSVTYDDGYDEGQPAGENGYAQATVRSPTFKPMGSDVVAWKSLPSDLMTDILTFPEHAHDEASPLDNEHSYDDPPDFSRYFADRQYTYVKLGLKALVLAERLHTHAKLVASDQGEALRQRLSERQAELEVERARREERIAREQKRWEAEFAATQA